MRQPTPERSQWLAEPPACWAASDQSRPSVAAACGCRGRLCGASPVGAASLPHLTWLDVLQPVDGVQDPQPDPHAGAITLLRKLIGADAGFEVGRVAISLDHD